MIQKSPVYYIAEIFESIQGEGNYAGIYCLFIRFQHCNLSCSWCDSKYTWYKNEQLIPQTIDEIKNLIIASKAQHVVITGGEPTLYQLDKIYVKNKKYHIETNGSIVPTIPLEIVLSDGSYFQREAMKESIIKNFNWVVSPKLKNAELTNNCFNFEFWNEKKWGVFKFIIQQESDIEEINSYVDKYGLDKNMIYLAIEGCTLQSQLKPTLVDKIIANGYHYSPRLHVILWGAKRLK